MIICLSVNDACRWRKQHKKSVIFLLKNRLCQYWSQNGRWDSANLYQGKMASKQNFNIVGGYKCILSRSVKCKNLILETKQRRNEFWVDLYRSLKRNLQLLQKKFLCKHLMGENLPLSCNFFFNSLLDDSTFLIFW